MLLSYSFRLLCLALLGIGAAQAFAELAFWLASPRLARMLDRSGARRQEQLLFWGQVMTQVLALLLTLVFFVPRYVAAETNLFAERVGYLSITAAALMLARYVRSLVHGLRMWWRAVQLERRAESVSISEPGLMSLPGPCPPLALVGLLRPRIFIAKTMLDQEKLSAEALTIALDHERAHVRHRDNWKLFTLTCLPHLGLHTRKRPTSMRLWQRYNDWAADDEAVNGSQPRALMLAESLIACAKSIPAAGQGFLFTGFAAHEDELSARIDRLLGFESPRIGDGLTLPMLLSCGGATLVTAILFLTHIAPWLHEAAETILHLG